MNLDPLKIFMFSFTITAFGGLFALVNSSHRSLSFRSLFSSFFYTGFLGLTFSFLFYGSFISSGNIYGLFGVCAGIGIGGIKFFEIAVSILSNGRLNIRIFAGRDSENEQP